MLIPPQVQNLAREHSMGLVWLFQDDYESYVITLAMVNNELSINHQSQHCPNQELFIISNFLLAKLEQNKVHKVLLGATFAHCF